MPYEGDLVVVEGPGGSGKSTVISELEFILDERGYSVQTVGEFSDTMYGKELENYWEDGSHPVWPDNIDSENGLTIAMAQLTDFVNVLESEIVPRLEENDYVIKERFMPSVKVLEPMIYEASYGEHSVFSNFLDTFEEVLPTDANYVFYLEVSSDERLSRLEEREISESNFDKEFTEIEADFKEVGGMIEVSNQDRSSSETAEEMADILEN